MTRKRWGRIINMALSSDSRAMLAKLICCREAGMIGLTKSLAKEFAARNVTVNAVRQASLPRYDRRAERKDARGDCRRDPYEA